MMKQEFLDKNKMKCIFTDKGIAFCDKAREIFYPYGCLDSLNLSLLGVAQAVCRSQVCCFAVSHKDKAEFKECYKKAREAMQTAPQADAVILDLTQIKVDENLPVDDQLKQYKAMFVQGIISKEQYDFKKMLLAD